MKYYKRGFLNKGEGMAAFESSLEREQFESSGKKYVQANFSITDCNRKISLDFYSSDYQDQENAMHKIDSLLAELKDFRSKLVAAYKWAHYEKEAKE